MKHAFAVLSGIVMAVAILPYVASVFRGETKPSKATWLIWASLDAITLAGMWASEALNWQMPVNLAGSATIAILSLRYGLPGWTTLDKVCLAGASAGIALWLMFSDPVLAILSALAASVIGSWPTFVSTYEDPSRENRVGWTLSFVSCVLAVLAVPDWTLAHAAQPVAFLLIMGTMMVLLYVPARARAVRAQPSVVQVGGDSSDRRP